MQPFSGQPRPRFTTPLNGPCSLGVVIARTVLVPAAVGTPVVEVMP